MKITKLITPVFLLVLATISSLWASTGVIRGDHCKLQITKDEFATRTNSYASECAHPLYLSVQYRTFAGIFFTQIEGKEISTTFTAAPLAQKSSDYECRRDMGFYIIPERIISVRNGIDEQGTYSDILVFSLDPNLALEKLDYSRLRPNGDRYDHDFDVTCNLLAGDEGAILGG